MWHKDASSWFQKEEQMNVGAYSGGSGERLPLLDAKMFKKLQKGGRVTGKILAVRDLSKPSKIGGWTGIALDLKNGTAKFAFLCGFDRFDIGAIVRQLGSEETDDWIGETIRFTTNKGSKGNRVFVNVENPKRKK
jgi:hypothetical protein